MEFDINRAYLNRDQNVAFVTIPVCGCPVHASFYVSTSYMPVTIISRKCLKTNDWNEFVWICWLSCRSRKRIRSRRFSHQIRKKTSWRHRQWLQFAAEASCHWGTWGMCPPDSVATVVNSIQNRVKSITVCVTLNANTGKIVLVTLCIQIEWLFYNAFWCETVTRKRRWLHPGHGARAHTFTNDWARGHWE